MGTKVKFINHASLQVTRDKFNLLIDPWYSGKVFNNSWSLIREGHENLQKNITHILISHEHPDHLHFPTLKYLKSNNFLHPNCVLIFPFRKENSVRDAIVKLGLHYTEIKSGIQSSIMVGDIKVAYYGEVEDGDHTIVLGCPDLTIVNQNDHYTSVPMCFEIKADWPSIDFFFTQFSLAGYYGNKNEPDIIKNNGSKFHIQRFIDYVDIFEPKFAIPFASFVYFCDFYNNYLNFYTVKPSDLSNIDFKNTQVQFALFGNEILSNGNEVSIRNPINLQLCQNLFDKTTFKIDSSNIADIEEIIVLLREHLRKIDLKKRMAFMLLKKPFKGLLRKDLSLRKNKSWLFSWANKVLGFVRFVDHIGLSNRYLYINLLDYKNVSIRIDTLFCEKIALVEARKKVDFAVPSRQILFAMKFPWGVDTLNVTATSQIYSAKAEVLLWLIYENNLRS